MEYRVTGQDVSHTNRNLTHSVMSTIFIGQYIEQELRRQGKSAAWLSEEIGCNRTNIYKIFHRYSIDSELLLRISKALGQNFFKPYEDLLEELKTKN